MSDMVQLNVRDMKGDNDLKITIDWDYRNQGTVLHAQMGKEKAMLNADDLWKIAFILANEEKQEKLIPHETKITRHFTKMVKIKATRDIKAGEMLVSRVTFSIPDNVLKELVGGGTATSSGILAPKSNTKRIIK